MDRSLYPEGVEVHQTDLERTETTKTNHIIRRFLDTTTTGLVEGCNVTSTATVATIAVGRGYSNGGDWIDVSIVHTVTLNTGQLNWICAIYTETPQSPGTHVTTGIAMDREVVRGSRIVVLSDAEYQALPASDANFENNALDRVMLLAKITQDGNSPPTSFEQSVAFKRVMSIDRGALGTDVVIPGVKILEVSTDTTAGTGVLKWDGNIAATTNNFDATTIPALKYTAPGDTEATGPTTWTSVATGGVFTLTSSGASSAYIKVEVNPDFLMVNVSNGTENLTISALYEQDLVRTGASDNFHRTIMGALAASNKNPHGLDIADIVPHYASFPGGIELGNAPDVVNRPSLVANVASGFVKTLIAKFGGDTSGSTRIYVTDTGALEIVTDALWAYDLDPLSNAPNGSNANWIKEPPDGNSTKWVISRGEIKQYYVNYSQGVTFKDSDWKELTMVGSGDSSEPADILTLGNGMYSTTADALIPRLNMPMGSTRSTQPQRTLLFSSLFDMPTNPYDTLGDLRVYRYVNSIEREIELVYNAEVDSGGQWNRTTHTHTDNVEYKHHSTRYSFRNGIMEVWFRDKAEDNAWTEAGWTSRGYWHFSETTPLDTRPLGLNLDNVGPINGVPATPAVPIANSIYSTSAAKAGGVIVYGGGGASLVSNSGFGVHTTTPVTCHNDPGGSQALYLEVNLALPMANTLYPILLQYYGPEWRFLSVKDNTTVSSFRIYIGNGTTGAYFTLADGWSHAKLPGKLSFVVYGDQA